MTRRAPELRSTTPDEWLSIVQTDMDGFIQDHANCERKASALAMSLVVKYRDRAGIVTGLVDIAEEELRHYRQTWEIMRRRGLPLAPDEADPYVNALLALARHGREQRFIDRMLLSSLIECRGAERFGILARGLPDAELRGFYEELWKAEIKHGNQFMRLLLAEADADAVAARSEELAEAEAEIVSELPLRARLH